MEDNNAILTGIAMLCSTALGIVFIASHYCYIGVIIGGTCQ